MTQKRYSHETIIEVREDNPAEALRKRDEDLEALVAQMKEEGITSWVVMGFKEGPCDCGCGKNAILMSGFNRMPYNRQYVIALGKAMHLTIDQFEERARLYATKKATTN